MQDGLGHLHGAAKGLPSEVGLLTPGAAELVADEIRYQLGLGQAYHVDVHANEKGDWEIDDGLGHHDVVHPMNENRWKQWFIDQYQDVISERLETSEG